MFYVQHERIFIHELGQVNTSFCSCFQNLIFIPYVYILVTALWLGETVVYAGINRGSNCVPAFFCVLIN